MARPRIHDEELLLDAAEILLANGEPSSLSIRSLSAATGAPSGTLYHLFGSRMEIVGRLWLRAGNRFLNLQNELIDEAVSKPGTDQPTYAVIAAAGTLWKLKERYPQSSAIISRFTRDELVSELDNEILVAKLTALDAQLIETFKRLATLTLGRADSYTVEAVRVCLTNLPSTLFSDQRLSNERASEYLEAAIKGILALNTSR